jgi:hypothetical protein
MRSVWVPETVRFLAYRLRHRLGSSRAADATPQAVDEARQLHTRLRNWTESDASFAITCACVPI